MANKNNLQIWAEYAAARGLLGLLRIVPGGAAARIGLSAGQLAYSRLGKLRKVGMRNLELAFPERQRVNVKRSCERRFAILDE